MRKEEPNLGTLLKITNLTTQRKYIETLLAEKIFNPSTDGDPTFRYTGHIFPENMEWLKKNGFEVFCNRVIDSDSQYYGFEDYIITPAKTIELTKAEYEDSNILFNHTRLKVIEEMINTFEEILNLPVNVVDDEDYDEEFDYDEENFENQIENYVNELRSTINENSEEKEEMKDVRSNEENFTDGDFSDSCDDGDFADSCDDGDFICENSDYPEGTTDGGTIKVSKVQKCKCHPDGSCKCGGNCNGSCHCGGNCNGNCKCGEHTEADDCDRECYE